MIIEKGSDLVLKIRDERGNGIRVANKASFFIKVFTTNKNQNLQYDKDSVVERGNYDTIYISADELATLDSGVIAYTYGWGINDDNFEDGEYNRLKTVYTEYYFKNDTGSTSNNPAIDSATLQGILDQLQYLREKLEWHEVGVQDNALIIKI